LTVSTWLNCLADMEKIIKQEYLNSTHNDFYVLYNSGARWSLSHLNQLSGMKWLVVSPSGKVIELPIKSSYLEWFNPLEYFISAHGARKWRADTALKTADAWYLTRRLCDSTQEVIIKEEDCGSSNYIVANKYEIEGKNQSFSSYLYGRFAAKDIHDDSGNLLVEANAYIGKPNLSLILNWWVDSVYIRSPLTCHTISWVCQKCFGMDLASRQVVAMWVPVWIISSQSIWEPGTQLTMNTRHAGWLASADWDITW
jgi:DNA-directed RNA polymerase subunit beta'